VLGFFLGIPLGMLQGFFFPEMILDFFLFKKTKQKLLCI
jgi:hypothetical protein